MPPNPVFMHIKALGDSFALLKEDFAIHKSRSVHHNRVLHEKIKLLTIQNRDLSTCITHLEGVLYKSEMNGEGTSVDPNLGEGSTGDMLGSNEGNSMVWDTYQRELEKAERSAEAAESNMIKVSNSISL